jgi:hypothetical protein
VNRTREASEVYLQPLLKQGKPGRLVRPTWGAGAHGRSRSGPGYVRPGVRSGPGCVPARVWAARGAGGQAWAAAGGVAAAHRRAGRAP